MLTMFGWTSAQLIPVMKVVIFIPNREDSFLFRDGKVVWLRV